MEGPLLANYCQLLLLFVVSEPCVDYNLRLTCSTSYYPLPTKQTTTIRSPALHYATQAAYPTTNPDSRPSLRRPLPLSGYHYPTSHYRTPHPFQFFGWALLLLLLLLSLLSGSLVFAGCLYRSPQPHYYRLFYHADFFSTPGYFYLTPDKRFPQTI